MHRRELCSERGIERQKDWDVASAVADVLLRASVLVRLPVKGSRETESGQSVVEGAGTSGCGAKNRDGGAPGAGVSVKVRDLRRTQVRE
jgi:hypothetical protein